MNSVMATRIKMDLTTDHSTHNSAILLGKIMQNTINSSDAINYQQNQSTKRTSG